jgi:type IV secretory pathway VirB2 component (pilin)
MKKFICFVGLVSLMVFALAPVVSAQIDFGTNDMDTLADSAGYGEANFTDVAGKIINVVFSLLGLAAVIIIIVAGFQWMTSGGDKEKIDGAKKLMTSALVGLIIVVLAYAIADFVMSKLTNLTE